MSDSVHILCAFDDNYAPQFATMWRSLTAAWRDRRPLGAVLVSNFLTPTMRERVGRVVANLGGTPRWIELDMSRLNDAPVTMHFTLATYARIVAFHALEDIGRVLYLDPDLICLADLGPLFDVDLQENVIGAVLDPGNTFHCDTHKDALGIPRNAICFNCGVLVVDLVKWREQKCTEACLQFLAAHRAAIQWVDQDVMNGVFLNRWTRVPSVWNVQTDFWKGSFRDDLARTMPAELEVINWPKIVHFNDPTKPWHFGYPHPYREHYLQFLAASGWPHAVYQMKQGATSDKMVMFGN